MATNTDFVIEFIGQLDKRELNEAIAEFSRKQIDLKVNTDEIKEAIREFAKANDIKISTREIDAWTKKFIKAQADAQQASERRTESERQNLIENARIQEQLIYQAIDGILAETDAQVQLNQVMRDMNLAMQQRDTQKLQDIQKAYERIGKKLNNIRDSNVGFLEENKEIGAQVEKLVTDYEQLGGAIASGDTTGAVDGLVKMQTELDGVTTSIKRAKSSSQTFFEMLKENFTKFGAWSIITFGYFALINQMKDAVQQVIDLDASLVELRKVTDLSGSSLEKFTEDAFKAGQEVGRTGKEVIDATAEFARSGYTIKESLDLGKEALTMVNIADNMHNTGEAAKKLIAILKAYGLEADKARYVNDVLNEVSNTSAISFDDLAESISIVGSTFNQSGVDIEHLSGLMVGANEIINDVSKSAHALQTISLRLRG